MISKQCVEAILESEPMLNAAGFGFEQGWNSEGETKEQWLLRKRQLIVDDWEIVEQVLDWLENNATMRQTINKRRTSYGWKHVVEQEIGTYVSNGVLITAALLRGHSYRQIPNNLSVWLDMGRPRASREDKEEREALIRAMRSKRAQPV